MFPHRLAVVALSALMALAPVSARAPQTPAPPTLKDANAFLAAGKNDEAAAAFQALVQADKGDLSAWLGLGQAQENLGQADKALATYAKLLDLSPAPVFQTRMAMASIAGVYAVQGKRELAYDWLTRLADSHPAPAFVALVSGAKEFASLKGDPKFAQILDRLKPCNSAEYHQFDFWVGSWEVQNPQGQTLGHNDINRMIGGCILQENWASLRGQSGTSFNFYDNRDGKWHQDYYDNSGNMGNYPPLAGGLRDGRMVLVSPPGVEPLSRWTWYALPQGRVRQMAEQSTDGGRTWSITWDSIYIRK